jgi:hypothetical protein
MRFFSKARAWTLSGCAISLMMLSAPARAEVWFDSLHSPNTGVMGENIGFTYPADASFATGASTFHATNVALLLEQIAPGVIFPDDDFTVSLHGGVPLADVTFDPILGLNVLPGQGPVLGSVTLPISELSTTLTVEHFSQFASIALQPNSFYWIDLNLSGPMTIDGPSVGWGTTDDNAGPGVSEGYNSSNPTDFTFFPNNRDGGEEAFQMEVASVPEPSTWGMMLIGFAGLGYAGYRAQRKPAALAASSLNKEGGRP